MSHLFGFRSCYGRCKNYVHQRYIMELHISVWKETIAWIHLFRQRQLFDVHLFLLTVGRALGQIHTGVASSKRDNSSWPRVVASWVFFGSLSYSKVQWTLFIMGVVCLGLLHLCLSNTGQYWRQTGPKDQYFLCFGSVRGPWGGCFKHCVVLSKCYGTATTWQSWNRMGMFSGLECHFHAFLLRNVGRTFHGFALPWSIQWPNGWGFDCLHQLRDHRPRRWPHAPLECRFRLGHVPCRSDDQFLWYVRAVYSLWQHLFSSQRTSAQELSAFSSTLELNIGYLPCNVFGGTILSPSFSWILYHRPTLNGSENILLVSGFLFLDARVPWLKKYWSSQPLLFRFLARNWQIWFASFLLGNRSRLIMNQL